MVNAFIFPALPVAVEFDSLAIAVKVSGHNGQTDKTDINIIDKGVENVECLPPLEKRPLAEVPPHTRIQWQLLGFVVQIECFPLVLLILRKLRS